MDVFPSCHAIHVNHSLVPTLKTPRSLLSRLYDQQVVSPGGASHSPWIKSLAPVTLHDLSQTLINSPAVTVGDQLLPPNSACVISVRVKHAPIGTTILSLPESCNVKRLLVESTLTSICHDYISELLVLNRTGCEVTLKTGTRLADVQVYGTQLMDFSDESGLAQSLTVANVSSNSDSSNVSPHPLHSHVTLEDYHEGIQTSSCVAWRTSWHYK